MHRLFLVPGIFAALLGVAVLASTADRSWVPLGAAAVCGFVVLAGKRRLHKQQVHWRDGAIGAGLGAAALAAVVGSFVLLGVIGVVIVFGSSLAFLMESYESRRGATVEEQVAADFNRMSTGELCDLWEAAWRERNEPADIEQTMCVATIRGLVLEELERRDRAAFQEWLHRGDPSRAHGQVGGSLRA